MGMLWSEEAEFTGGSAEMKQCLIGIVEDLG